MFIGIDLLSSVLDTMLYKGHWHTLLPQKSSWGVEREILAVKNPGMGSGAGTALSLQYMCKKLEGGLKGLAMRWLTTTCN